MAVGQVNAGIIRVATPPATPHAADRSGCRSSCCTHHPTPFADSAERAVRPDVRVAAHVPPHREDASALTIPLILSSLRDRGRPLDRLTHRYHVPEAIGPSDRLQHATQRAQRQPNPKADANRELPADHPRQRTVSSTPGATLFAHPALHFLTAVHNRLRLRPDPG
mgnify:CR=1 FL=1